MDSRTTKALALGLPLGALGIIGVGVWLALGGSGFGWAIAAFGVLDLATVPLVLRAAARRTTGSSPARESEADPTADPSYNPYRRED